MVSTLLESVLKSIGSRTFRWQHVSKHRQVEVEINGNKPNSSRFRFLACNKNKNEFVAAHVDVYVYVDVAAPRDTTYGHIACNIYTNVLCSLHKVRVSCMLPRNMCSRWQHVSKHR